MQSTANGVPPSQPGAGTQQQMAYEPQYYYTAQMPTGTSQGMPTYMAQPGTTPAPGSAPMYATTTAQTYYQDANGQYVAVQQPQQTMLMHGQPYIYMQTPQNGPTATPQPQQANQHVIYYQQPMGSMPIQQQPAQPVYYQMPAQMVAPNEHMNGAMPQMQQNMQPQHMMSSECGVPAPRVAPLTSSTPLPTMGMEYQMQQQKHQHVQNNQMAGGAQAGNYVHFRYHRQMEHDEVPVAIDEISKITIDDAHDDTVSAERENHIIDQRSDKSSRRGGLSCAQSMQNLHLAGSGASSALPHNQPFNYKTRLCMMHASGKTCEMGPRCKFAHGLEELRTVDLPVRAPNNKYKTKLCKNFARGGSGFCPYGLRCEFVHPIDKEFQGVPVYQRMVLTESSRDLDVTPETDGVMSKQKYMQQSRSAAKSAHATKVLLKHRNVAGSMMCLASRGTDAPVAGGDFNKPNTSGHENLPPHLRSRAQSKPNLHTMGKFSRRRSLSQLKLKWTSEEQLAHV